ncbi:hypothetical protein LCGC14_1905910 [marine sediment metagenome]|uniref:Uncharacterized protein n=1 Tax=marine sediment metagenome TaxID=412755 RepID=A0A0F9FV80_9ZZZZ
MRLQGWYIDHIAYILLVIVGLGLLGISGILYWMSVQYEKLI